MVVAETGARWGGDRKVKDGYVVVLKVRAWPAGLRVDRAVSHGT